MSLADALPAKRDYRKLLDAIRDQLPPADRATLDQWLSDPSISNRRIAAALSSQGHQISEAAVRNHRTAV